VTIEAAREVTTNVVAFMVVDSYSNEGMEGRRLVYTIHQCVPGHTGVFIMEHLPPCSLLPRHILVFVQLAHRRP
jgi:hypothetical protein